MGYHLRDINKGIYGHVSKIQEELEELIDAEEQSNSIMMLIELSDLVGAIEGYLKETFPDFTMDDLQTMSHATRRAFADGSRK